MNRLAARITRSAPLLMLAASVCLPIALANDTHPPATSEKTPTTHTATATTAPTSRPSDREIELREGRRMIEETAAVYKNCKSYQDEGEVVTVFFTNVGTRTFRTPFKTVFIRDYRFRFEFRNPISDAGKYIVWANENDVRTWAYVLVERPAKLGLAIAGATRDSSGSAHSIPALLLPKQIEGRTLADLHNIRFVDQEKSRGVLYNILEAEEKDGHPVRIWIDADSKLICKILRKTFHDFRSEETTTYKPKININASAKDLDFNAPTIIVDQSGNATFSDK